MRLAWISFWIGLCLSACGIAYAATDPPPPPASPNATQTTEAQPLATLAPLPTPSIQGVPRKVYLVTHRVYQGRLKAQTYEVQFQDSLFSIAQRFGLTPETLFWANQDLLKNDPHMLYVGMKLRIPPTDGVYYRWKEGDTLEHVARRYQVSVEDILAFPGNHLDPTDPNPSIEPGTWIMIPGGKAQMVQWLIPVIPRGRAGVALGYLGPGMCQGQYFGPVGSGNFIWPVNFSQITQPFWSGHMALDIGLVEGAPVRAADHGVVVFAGWSVQGYGNTVMIDHGNGFHTLYAHLSQVNVKCGDPVRQGQVVALGGNTGRSTGPHLHFEIRYNGGVINPLYVVSPP